jgi:hypothetical protein
MKTTDIIEYENENTSLDFKRDQYRKENYLSLLKDIISLANADTTNEKIIITGLKHLPSGERDFVGISDSEIIDEATYQNIIRDNIEPDIEISYTYEKHRDKNFGILRILNDTEKPYMMKKDYQTLKRGDCFIRKGSNQQKAIRADFEKIYSLRKQPLFNDQIIIGFSGDTLTTELPIRPPEKFTLPSEAARQKIQEILAERELQSQTMGNSFGVDLQNLRGMAFNSYPSFFGSTPYSQRSTNTLKENLKTIKETYRNDDEYAISEIYSEKINIEIRSTANEYIIDAEIQIEIQHKDTITIAESIIPEPNNSPFSLPYISTLNNYPEVTNTKDRIHIKQKIGDIKHQKTTIALDEDLRVICKEINETKELDVEVKIFAKNIPNPISKTLKLIILPKQPAN